MLDFVNDAPAPDLPQLRAVVAGLAQIDWNVNDATRIGLLDALERVKNAACGAQALGACALDDATRRRDAEAGISSNRRGRGVAAQVGLARSESHHSGQVHLGLAKNLRAELPNTLARLQDGTLSEWRATLIARETAHLSPTHRGNIDAALCKDPKTLHGWGNRRIVAEAKKLAYELDPRAVVERNARAHSERRISCRPAPDSMAYLTALVPMTQGVAALAAVKKAAVSILGQDGGDPQQRSLSQIEADVLIERLTGQTHADAVPLTVNLVLSDRALLTNCDDETAHLDGYGPIPAEIARRVITTSTTPHGPATPTDGEAATVDKQAPTADQAAPTNTDDGQSVTECDEPAATDNPTTHGADAPTACAVTAADDDLDVPDELDAPIPDDFDSPIDTDILPVWLRRVYASPATGALVAMESTARLFPEAMADYLRLRDQFCRTPYCDAPIRHSDHVEPHATGGATSLDNGDGLCEACNHAKQANGWITRTTHSGTGLHTIHLTTPAGITYLSTAPPAPGHDRRLSLVETHLAEMIDAA